MPYRDPDKRREAQREIQRRYRARVRERTNAEQRQRWADDPEYKARVAERQKRWARAAYAADPSKHISKVRRQQRKRWEYIAQAKAKPCMDCGRWYAPWMMDFDHRDASTKLSDLTRLWSSAGMERIKAEIEKCDVVCANCHRARTHQRSHGPDSPCAGYCGITSRSPIPLGGSV